jgi:hypothetical protein
MGLLVHELTHVIQQHAGGSAKLQRQVKDTRKLQVVSTEATRRVKVAEYLRETTTGGVPTKEAIYWIDFEVDKQGVVRASVRTVTPDRAYRSANLRFGDEFRRALAHFKAAGVEVTAFEGDWSYMTREEISENLKAFKEGMAQGMTREKAAGQTPTGKVAAASGFEVTHVENVPESQSHLKEEKVRRWRVRAIFRRPPLVPTHPPARGVSGEITTTPLGGPGKVVTPGVENVARAGRMGHVVRGIGGAVGVTAVSLALSYLGGRLIDRFEQKRIRRDLERLLPDIKAAIEGRQSEIKTLLKQTGMRERVYANITIDVIYSFDIDPDGPPMVNYFRSELVGVDVSTTDISKEGLVREQVALGHYDHHRTTYSTPVAVPAGLVIPAIQNIHRLLNEIRKELIAAGGGSAGEAVASDYIGVALQATQTAGPTPYESKTGAERFQLTADAILTSMSVLEGPATTNPAIDPILGRLWHVKTLLDGLEDQWSVMVNEQ